MCDTYIPAVGYICSECQQEFKLYVGNSCIIHELELIEILDRFLQCNLKYNPKPISINLDEFFERHTRI